MKKIAPLAGLIVTAILTASCGHSMTPALTPAATAPQSATAGDNARFTSDANVPNGWAATATRGVPLGGSHTSKTFGAALSQAQPMRIVVGLGMRDRKGADALVRSQYTAGVPAYHAFLTPAQFTSRFNPTLAQANSVAAYLRQKGFTHVEIEPNRLMVTATGKPAQVESAFNTTIRSTRANGGLAYANVTPAYVPAQFKGLVVAVLGLNNIYRMNTHHKISDHRMQPATAGTPPPCFQVVNNVCLIGEYGPAQYQVAYDAAPTSCKPACSTGAYTNVAVMAEGNVSSVLTDLRTAESFWGLPKVAATVRQVGLASADTAGVDEWDLDTQVSTGIAQTVKHLYLYATTSMTDSDIALEFSKWVNDDVAVAGNASFGEIETQAFADGAMMIDDEEFAQAAAQGQSMFASTGDNGEGCPVVAATGVPQTGVPEPCYPADSPYVVAVGGTTLDTNAVGDQPGTYYGEHVWVGTGGGYSKFESAPYWQSNGICPGCNSFALRGIADISMCADNNGCPFDVFVGGAQTGIGGTSLSSPMSMGIWARLQSHFGNKLGFAAPVYYGVYAHYEPCPLGSTVCVPSGEVNTAALPPDTTAPIGGFHDILMGSNGIPASAAPGWDTPTGLGSIDYAVMQRDIANSAFSGH